ncbi:MAG: flagellar basal body P-ring formation chaperone FlgA [Pyrinomonadaceae bacterium]|nr:flagellar basal body P-ring formation chaperone FlgA [Pyrinomonadaceae bacterium]
MSLNVSAQTKTQIRLASETTVTDEYIKLGNIAEITGEEVKTNRLKQISLGYAPKAGMFREIRREQITLLIAAAGFSENEVLLDAPTQILIRRASQNLNENLLKQAVETEVLKNFQSENVNAKLVRLDLPSNVALPSGEISVKADAKNVRNFFTPFSVSIEIRVDNVVSRRFSATAQVEAFGDILVANRNLISNEKISETDVRIEKRRLEKPLTSYFQKFDKLRGAVSLKNIAEGTELTSDSFAAGVVVRNGDLVKIEGVSGKIKIIVSGEARASGKIGDRISVKNSQSCAILQATVIDQGLVRINF